MEKAIEIFVAINLFVIGASHLFQPQAWVDFFKVLKSYGRAGAMANGFLSLTFGSIILAFHWNWEGVVPSVVTLLGLAQIIKSFVAFVFPEAGLRSMHRPAAENPWAYRIGGILFLLLSFAVGYHLLV